MESEEYQKYLGRLSEAQICLEQGLVEETADLLQQLLAELEVDSLPPSAKEEIRSRADSMLGKVNPTPTNGGSSPQQQTGSIDPIQSFNYGLALMDGRFWEEAIVEFRTAAELGHEPLTCWEYCGDCASSLDRWDEAILFYNNVYKEKDLQGPHRKRILTKITKCSQTQKKADVQSTMMAKSSSTAPLPDKGTQPEFVNSSIDSLDSCSVDSILGQTVSSWCENGRALSSSQRIYRVTNLLHVGSSSLVVELEDLETGHKSAGQNLTGKFGDVLSPEKLHRWAEGQKMIDSRHLVKISDLAHSSRHFFIVREHLPLSLNDLLATSEPIPISLAVRFAYQALEGLGDIHLNMGKDGTIRNHFHLDLRPSRILCRKDLPCAKLYNSGLWMEMEKSSKTRTEIGELPLPYLSYRAPEQFRTYLSRKRPPIFTDIYLFGTLFYELLTGTPAFKASSFAEYEIQHCEQYPAPPKVWRPEIPEILNDLIMKCLQCDPTKRWRSTTQISLLIEKSFPNEVTRPKDDSYIKYLQKMKLI
ncbi:MAG: protein kinase [Syntrophobacteraceae bacterium]